MTGHFRNIYQQVEQRLFPDYVRLVLTREPLGMESLFPEEKKLMKNASAGRRADFATGRWCARKALSYFNVESRPILNDEARQPLWPSGFVGSISHCPDLYGAVVAKREDCRSLGFDIESVGRKVEEDYIAKIICHPEEYEDIMCLSGKELSLRSRTIFSTKECIFKCLFPIVRTFIGFKSVTVEINEEKGKFNAQLMKDIKGEFSRGKRLEGRFSVVEKYVFSGMCISP